MGLFLFKMFIPSFIIGWNIWKIVKYHNRTKEFVRASAKVINASVEEVTVLRGGWEKFYSPIIEFTTKEGERYVLKYNEDNPDLPLYKIGEELTICYDPQEPRRFIIYDPKAEYLVASAWILVGLVIFYLMFFFNWDSKPPF